MTLARLELHNLKTAIEKRKKHAAEKVKPAPGAHTCVTRTARAHTRKRVFCAKQKKLGLLTRMKSWRSVRSIASQFSFRSGGSGNSGATKSEKDKGSVWKTISRNTLLPATKVTHRVAPPVTHTTVGPSVVHYRLNMRPWGPVCVHGSRVCVRACVVLPWRPVCVRDGARPLLSPQVAVGWLTLGARARCSVGVPQGPTRARDVTSGGSSQDMEPRARRPSQPPVVFHAPAETSPRSDGPL